jgi:hypothetical protein
MTTPYERTRAVLDTKWFLEALQHPSESPGVPEQVREQARRLLRHYPSGSHLALAHRALPMSFGPVVSIDDLQATSQDISVLLGMAEGADVDLEPPKAGPFGKTSDLS